MKSKSSSGNSLLSIIKIIRQQQFRIILLHLTTNKIIDQYASKMNQNETNELYYAAYNNNYQ